ncbi:MAG: 2Fe-2S iron-sulfur cluster binding domain-containing protein [Gammaproteobacteria bacterium]
MTKICRVKFPGTRYGFLDLPACAKLSEHLTVENSPVLFGCRTGLCGTCLIEIVEQRASVLQSPGADEAETLAIYAPGNPRARLACQIELTADICLRKIDGQ